MAATSPEKTGKDKVFDALVYLADHDDVDGFIGKLGLSEDLMSKMGPEMRQWLGKLMPMLKMVGQIAKRIKEAQETAPPPAVTPLAPEKAVEFFKNIAEAATGDKPAEAVQKVVNDFIDQVGKSRGLTEDQINELKAKADFDSLDFKDPAALQDAAKDFIDKINEFEKGGASPVPTKAEFPESTSGLVKTFDLVDAAKLIGPEGLRVIDIKDGVPETGSVLTARNVSDVFPGAKALNVKPVLDKDGMTSAYEIFNPEDPDKHIFVQATSGEDGTGFTAEAKKAINDVQAATPASTPSSPGPGSAPVVEQKPG